MYTYQMNYISGWGTKATTKRKHKHKINNRKLTLQKLQGEQEELTRRSEDISRRIEVLQRDGGAVAAHVHSYSQSLKELESLLQVHSKKKGNDGKKERE